MSKSRRNPERKDKLKKYKAKHKKMDNVNQSFPEVRNFPVWTSSDTITMSGAEWKVISDFVNSAVEAYSAVNQVMSRNIVDGTVKLTFEKFNKEKMTYEPMSEEEQAPYQEDVKKAVLAAKAQLKVEASKTEANDLPEEPQPDQPNTLKAV